MKTLIKILCLSVLWFSCSGYNDKKPSLDNFGASFSNELTKPSEFKVIILPTSVNGHPEIEYSKEDTQKINIAFKNLNYNVVDILFVEDWLVQNEVFDPKNASLSILKQLQENFNADAIVISNTVYEYIPSTEIAKSSSYSIIPSNDVNVEVNVDDESNFNNLTSFYSNKKKKDGFSTSGSSSTKIGEHYKNTFSSIKLMNTINQDIIFEIYSKSGYKFQDIYDAIEKHYYPNKSKYSILEVFNASYITFFSTNLSYSPLNDFNYLGDFFHFRPKNYKNIQFKFTAFEDFDNIWTNTLQGGGMYSGIGYFYPIKNKLPILNKNSFSANFWIYLHEDDYAFETILAMESYKIASIGIRPELAFKFNFEGEFMTFMSIKFLTGSFGDNF